MPKEVKRSKIKIAIMIIVPIVIVIAVLFFFGLLSFPSPPAKLISIQGDVSVLHGDWIAGKEGMELFEEDSVKTGNASKAVILFFGSSITRLDENTIVKISDVVGDRANRTVKLEQSTGNVWNKITQLSGIDNFEVETPTTITSVRGTTFFIRIGRTTDVGVIRGRVMLATRRDKMILARADLNESRMVSINPAELSAIQIRELIRDNWISANEQLDEQFLQEVKKRFKEKYANALFIVKSQYNLTDADIDTIIDNYLRGAYSKEQIGTALQQLEQMGIILEV